MKQIIAVFTIIIACVLLLIWGIRSLPKDTRSVNEILQDKYKDCIKYNRPDAMDWCSGYLKYVTQ